MRTGIPTRPVPPWRMLSAVCGISIAALVATAVAVPAPAATPPAAKAPAAKPAAKPAPKPSVVAVRAADLKAGGTLFAQYGCGACHTLAAARVAGTAGPNLDILGLPVAEIVGQLTHGSIAMPSFRTRLTPKQIAQLAGYVAASARARTTRPRDARSLFLGYCGSCHLLQAAGSRGVISVNLDAQRYTDRQVIFAVVTQHPLALGFGIHFSTPELSALAVFVAGSQSPADASPATTTTAAAAAAAG